MDVPKGIRTIGSTRRVLRDPLRIVTVASLCLLALAVYLYRLDVSPLWWDEGISISTSQASLSELLRVTATDDVHPPGQAIGAG